MIGTLLSPIISGRLGYLGNYAVFGGLALLAGSYLKFAVKEPPISATDTTQEVGSRDRFYKNSVSAKNFSDIFSY
jgi:hypothetical protein